MPEEIGLQAFAENRKLGSTHDMLWQSIPYMRNKSKFLLAPPPLHQLLSIAVYLRVMNVLCMKTT